MDFLELKEAIENIFGKQISNRPDCEALSESIYSKTKRKISYNTLRRLFGLAGIKNTTSLSAGTLDILANYCNYISYSEFQKKKALKTNLSVLYRLQLELQQNEHFRFENIELSLRQLTYVDQAYNYMNSVILLAFKRNDTALLKQIFQFKQIFNGEHYLNSNLYYLIQTIGLQTRNHPEIADQLWEYWSKDESARYYYFELFVDMDYLIISHYRALTYYYTNSTKPQDILFSSSLLTWRHLILKENEEVNKYLSIIHTIDFQKNIHPIVVARIYNALLLNDFLENQKSSKKLLEKVHQIRLLFDSESIPFFEFWICESLVLTKNYELAVQCIDSIYLKTTDNVDDYYLKGSIEKINAIANFCKSKLGISRGKDKTAINLNAMDIYSKEYDSLFYYAQRKENLNDTTVSKIKHLGYSNLFELL
jgi:hypothetical protein